ncbi:MAG: hypothetical protein K2Y23_03995 [Cyanobacteria bacterium]|nr:hypothetical protein [Cyanobacteriota bacterium]
MALNWSEVDDVLLRARGEYLEMPGLRLTPAQAQRLLGVDALAARSVIQTLVDAKFLRETPDGAFVRADSGRARY